MKTPTNWRSFTTFTVVASLPLVAVLWRAHTRDILTPTLRRLAGPSAHDCSFSSLPADQKKWDAMLGCSVNSYSSRRPFWVVEDTSDPNSESGVALSPDGQYYRVRQTHPFWRINPEITITRVVHSSSVPPVIPNNSYTPSDGHIGQNHDYSSDSDSWGSGYSLGGGYY